MVEVIGEAVRVVDTGHLSIEEFAGNVATKDDRLSIAHVKVTEPTSEPWLTLHYDEWICVLKGRMVLLHGNNSTEVRAGQTVFIAKGSRFQPTFPEATEYIPVCLPAFRPDRCIREEEPGGAVSAKLKELHNAGHGGYACDDDPAPEVMYHMCEKALWEKAKTSGTAYFPPTFEKDGFTHATAVPSRLLEVANHFYQDVPGEWLCLRFRRSALLRLGIITRDEQAKPVGEKDVSSASKSFVWPHVFGGIPPQVVEAEFPMERSGSAFLGIIGLTKRVFKLATAAEVQRFSEQKQVLSDLDRKDGFIHLSDASAAREVAQRFFAGKEDLLVLEVDVEKLQQPVRWIYGTMGDPEPDQELRQSASVVHYLKPDGCVHIYGSVPWDAVRQREALPLQDGKHCFPTWM